MSTNAYDNVLAPQMDGELAPPEDRTLIGRTKEIAITIDDIQEFPLNPRQSDNPRLDEIMASIEAIGLQQPLTVTKRPGEGV
ncbi:ParB N-terminal domain-containing protein, partial [uncultured Cardiobacterium sp.]|uniref:ParB N-terminal domain-containing protein n=1 Tax=uncultured Cardiobacterium sp. TaxID=417619 RepID=UPI00260F5ECD